MLAYPQRGNGDVYLSPPHYQGDPHTDGLLAFQILRSQTGRPARGVGFGGNFLRTQSPPSFVIDCGIVVTHQ
jgi:hypothetical protein